MNSILKQVYHKFGGWSVSAVKCYQRGCSCSECELIAGLETVNENNCYMKSVVLQLVKSFGKPSVQAVENANKFM